jgi:hypothetical protein
VLAVPADPALGREVAGVAHGSGAGGQHVAVERQHDIRLGEVVARLDQLAEGLLGSGTHRVATGGLPLVALDLRIRPQHALPERLERRRRRRSGEHADTDTLERDLGVEVRLERRLERAPGARALELEDRLRAVGIVERQDRGLGDRVGRAEARGVLRVAFDLRRPPHVALGEHRLEIAEHRHRRGEEQRPAGEDLLRLLDVGDDLLERLLGAGGEAGERQRGARELQEVAAREALACRVVALGGPLGRMAWELALQHLFELRRRGKLFEAAPELRALGVAQALAHRREIQRGSRGGRLLPLDVAIPVGGSALGVVFRALAHRALLPISMKILTRGQDLEVSAYRWQVEQLIKFCAGRILYSFTSSAPRTS